MPGGLPGGGGGMGGFGIDRYIISNDTVVTFNTYEATYTYG